MQQVLLVDDDLSFLRRLVHDLKQERAPFDFLIAADERRALRIAEESRPCAAVIDLSLDLAAGPASGLTALVRLHELDPTMRCIVLTGHESERWGIQALYRGAGSFLQKPADPKHLLALLRDAAACTELKRRALCTVKTPHPLAERIGMSTKSPAMLKTLEMLSYAAGTAQPVLLIGETGTGKGVAAQAVHRASRRSGHALIRIQPNFTGYDMIGSELFGHARGAFTGALTERKGLLEEAHRGTLFVDEVDQLPHPLQVQLLHVFQEKVFRRLGTNKELHSDFRLICASNRPFSELTGPSALRSDFYHRVSHCLIELPPLRDRLQDLPDLARDMIAAVANRESLPVQGLTEQAVNKLCSYAWPGNIRELQAVLESAVFRAGFAERAFIDLSDLAIGCSGVSPSNRAVSFRERVNNYESELIREALRNNGNNQSRAADSLQLDRSSFRRIMQRD